MRLLVHVILLCLAGLAPPASSQPDPTVINVEIDYMVEPDPFGHSHAPTASEIAAVVQMFACQGITLNVEVDDAIDHHFVLRRDPQDSTNVFAYDGGSDTFLGIKNDHFDHAGEAWHYAVFAHRYETAGYVASGSSGIAEVLGDDLIVSLGGFDGNIGTPWDRASTFAHELGHNLGLRHYGASTQSAAGFYMPNLTSVMSYFYQLEGVRTALQCSGLVSDDAGEDAFKELDYSHGRSCRLSESALGEAFGMGIVPVDWNCDGTIAGTTSRDVAEEDNGWCDAGGDLHAYDDYDEWANLEDRTGAAALLAPRPEVVECITVEEVARYRAMRESRLPAGLVGGCPQPTPTVEACARPEMSYLRPGFGVNSTGACIYPYHTVEEVRTLLSDGAILYLTPGAYPTAGAVFSRPLLLVGPGGAVIGD